jgi:hypothetical protein
VLDSAINNNNNNNNNNNIIMINLNIIIRHYNLLPLLLLRISQAKLSFDAVKYENTNKV